MNNNKRKKRKPVRRTRKVSGKMMLICVLFFLCILSFCFGVIYLWEKSTEKVNNEKNVTHEIETEQETEREIETEAETRRKNEDILEVSFLDIGQGDATLLQNGEYAVLIDTGSSEAPADIIKLLKEKEVTKLDYMILSHGHEDHMGRGCDILEQFPVDNVICDFGNQEGYVQRLEGMLADSDCNVIEPSAGDAFTCGNMEIAVLMGRNKEIPQTEQEVTNVNNQSLAIKIIHGENKFLFYGDGEAAYEEWMLKNGIDVEADVLKAPHHGGAVSGIDEMLEKSNPSYVVVSSAAQEEFGFPAQEALTRYGLHQITCFTTNKKGTVKVISDGETLLFSSEK